MEEVDVIEENLKREDNLLLRTLLEDKTTGRNIRWATSDYEMLGEGYAPQDEIVPELITGPLTLTIQPRVEKSVEEQIRRTKVKAEVFTPSWVCCAQNNLIDEAWFGREGAICSNASPESSWEVSPTPVRFDPPRTWKDYVDERVLEISCGEAPYLASRYDTVTGREIPVEERIGLLDRKLRVVGENTADDGTWYRWVLRAFEATYGFDLQGDNVLLARENLLYTFIDYAKARMSNGPTPRQKREVANRIAWNVFQMDGIELTTPYARREAAQGVFDLFGTGMEQPTEPVPCRVRDWRAKESVEFRSLVRGM